MVPSDSWVLSPRMGLPQSQAPSTDPSHTAVPVMKEVQVPPRKTWSRVS